MPNHSEKTSPTSPTPDPRQAPPTSVVDVLKEIPPTSVTDDVKGTRLTSVIDDLKWWEERYVALTSKLSDVTRQLAFAGLAAIWVVGKVEPSRPALPFPLALAALLFVAGLTADLFHGILGVIETRYVESKLGGGDRTVLETNNLSMPLRALLATPTFFFRIKLLLIVAAYAPLLVYITRVVAVT